MGNIKYTKKPLTWFYFWSWKFFFQKSFLRNKDVCKDLGVVWLGLWLKCLERLLRNHKALNSNPIPPPLPQIKDPGMVAHI
jgi:hypothetical protein